MKAIIKKLLREGINKNVEFTQIGEDIYRKIINNLNNIQYSELSSDDAIMTTDNVPYQLEGIKFNASALDKRFNVDILFCRMLSISNDVPASFDPSTKKLLFFIYPRNYKQITYQEYVNLASKLFPTTINESMFVHEFTHYLDNLRYKTSYKFNFPNGNDTQYFNSPEELNANFNEVLNKIQKTPSMLKFPLEMFINTALGLFDEQIMEYLSIKNINKIKNRLYQYYTKHKTSEPLNERIFNKESLPQIGILNSFIEFAAKELGIDTPKIKLKFSHDGLVTTAAYGDKSIQVYAKERALVDIMRSIAHEMTHMKQDIEGRLEPSQHEKNNAAGSPIENEANSKSGEIIRHFGKKYPQIYI